MALAGRVLAKHGDWVVTSWGIENTDPLHSYYGIAKSRVHESYGPYGRDSWVHHMSEKSWVQLDDFRAALYDAQARWPRTSQPPRTQPRVLTGGRR